MQHCQGPTIKDSMKLFARYTLNNIAMLAGNNNSTPFTDIPIVTALQSAPMFVKSTPQYPTIYVLTSDNTKHVVPDYATYQRLVGSNTLYDNIPHYILDFFSDGEPMK